MSGYLGSWKIDDLLTFTIVTIRVDTGNATDADSAPAYRVYEDETSTPILTGTMALLDSANTAGFYSEQITLSAANGFEKGKSYNIYISATVNSIAGATSKNLQIEAEVDANIVSDKTSYALSTAGIQAIWDALTSALTTVGSIGKLLVDNINATISSRASQTSLDTLDDYVDTEIGAIITTLGTPVTSIAADIAVIEGQTDDIGVAGAGLTALATQASVTAIKAKTDSLTFTKANEVDANVQSLNDTTLNGDGSGTPWGP